MGESKTRKIIALGIMLLFLGMTISSTTGLYLEKQSTIATINGNTFYVGGSGPGNYSSIQDAIDDSSDGDTVFVYDDSSPYYENMVVDKSINLIGEDKDTTTIDGDESEDVVYISADWVNISGFTIQNSRSYWEDAGIDIRSNYNTIMGNNIKLNDHIGIWLSSSSNNTIIGNSISNNSEGKGLWLWLSSSNTISDNSFLNDGLLVTNSSQNTVFNNTINGKPLVYLENESDMVIDDAGQVILINCDNITVQTQELSNTSVGIRLRDTVNCLISGNDISNNWKGITLEHSSNNNTIRGNTVSNNYYGIWLRSSSNTITDNNISNNYYGIVLTDSSNNNITGNNILNNKKSMQLVESNSNNIRGNTISWNIMGILLHYSYSTTIEHNNFIRNILGLQLIGSYSTTIEHNNFIRNIIQAFFECHSDDYFSNCWDRNYWNRPRILPKPIFGLRFYELYQFEPLVQFDCYPAQEPYDIGV